MKEWHAIILAGALIAGAIVFIFRWEIGAGTGRVYRLDRWTGAVDECGAPSQIVADATNFGFGVQYRCVGLTADEIEQKKLNPKVH